MRWVEGWKPKTLRQLATINYGKSPANILSDDGTYPVVGTGGAERLGTDYLYEGDSIILGRKGTIDRVHFASGRFWTIDTAYYLSHFNQALPRWLCYFLQTLDLRRMNEGTGVPSLSRAFLYKIEIPTPSEPEQDKIAEILASTDEAIEQTKALIAKQHRIQVGLMQDLLTRGIDEHGKVRSEKTHQFKDSPLGRIPMEWEVRTLDWIATEVVDCPHTTPTFLAEGILVARTSNIRNGRFIGEESYVSDSEYRNRVARLEPRASDVIFTREAPVGEAFIIPPNLKICLGQRTMLIRCNPDRCVPEYLLEVLYSSKMRIRFDRMVSGTTNPHLNVSDVRFLSIKRPPVHEQRSIAEHIGRIRHAAEQAAQQATKFRALKSALMQDLLTGEKRVTCLLEEERKHEKANGAE